jgi:exopolysaccharide biosynthesis polyprenyl glycosylphosphotransferase
MQTKDREALTDWLVEAGVTVHTKLIRLSGHHTDKTVEKIGNYTVLTSGMRLATGRQLTAKRMLDIAGGLVGILLTAVATIFVAPLIYIQSPGPIFFSQVRVGKNGRTFHIYKFRSMYMDAEERKAELLSQNELGGPVFKMKNDPRITPIGRFIRKYSIDELPQFFNVLKGDMSLVGTRPPTVDEYEQYESHHRGRLAFKPGITGLWQVSGRNDITDFEEIVELDTEYIANWSFGEDIKILWKTVKLVFAGDGE